MNPSVEPTASVPPAPPEWLRKRDGEVVRFELDKLRTSLERAAIELDEPPPADMIAELARMAIFFLVTHASSDMVGTDEVAEWVTKSLDQTGQSALARSYAKYQQRKIAARRSLVVCSSSRESAQSHWDKDRVVTALRELNLDARRARQVAGQVERRVLAGGFASLTTALVRELVNNELARWGITARLVDTRHVHVSYGDLRHQLVQSASPAEANRQVAGALWRDFALAEMVSRDVADALRSGLLRSHGLESPAQLAATAIDCTVLLRQRANSRDSITQLSAQLTQAAEWHFGVVALEGIETWLALAAESGDSPGQLAERFWQELSLRMRSSGATAVLNLSGGLSDATDEALGAGPLFRQPPLAAWHEFAAGVAQEILGLFHRDLSQWPHVRVDWHWAKHPGPLEQALGHRVARLIAEGCPIVIAFDRARAVVGEGLRRAGQQVRPVLDFMTINLPMIWRDAGSPRSLAALDDGLTHAIQLAVRGAVQRREFLRRLPHAAPQLDSARLALAPVGFDWTVRQLSGKSCAEDPGALALAESLVRQMRQAAEREGRHFALAVALDHLEPNADLTDSAHDDSSDELGKSDRGFAPSSTVTGLRRRMYAAGQIHAVAQFGMLHCVETPGRVSDCDYVAETLDWASRETQLLRLKLAGERRPSQSVVQWPEA